MIEPIQGRKLRIGDLFSLLDKTDVFVVTKFIHEEDHLSVLALRSDRYQGQTRSLDPNQLVYPLQADFYLKDGKFVAEII